MTDAEARMILHDLEHQGASSLSMEQIYAIRRAQGALDDISEAKRLLKLAVVDFSNIYDHIFDCDGMCDTCPIHGNRDTCDKWVHADEALKLLGEDGDTDGIAIQETEV